MRIFTAVIVATSLASSLAAMETGFLDRTVKLDGETYRYQVFIPPDWTPVQRWPIVLELHGAGYRGSDGIWPTNGAPGNAIRKDRSRFPAVFIFPQARLDTDWSNGAMQTMALAELDATVREFNGDPDRIYLTGFSQGGNGVLRMASKWPERFAAIVDVAGL